MLKRNYFIDDMCVKSKTCTVKTKIDPENLILKHFPPKHDMKIRARIDITSRILSFSDDPRWPASSSLSAYLNP